MDVHFWAIGTDATSESERASYGMSEGLKSTDGTIQIVDAWTTSEYTWTNPAPLPSYAPSEEFPNWPCINRAQFRTLRGYRATTNGGSDGFLFDWKVV